MNANLGDNDMEMSSIGSIETPFKPSMKLFLQKELSNFFEIEEILEVCKE